MQAVEKSDGELAREALLDGDATAPRLRERDALTDRDAAAPPRLGERDALTDRDGTPPLRERDALTDRDATPPRLGERDALRERDGMKPLVILAVREGDRVGVTIVHCT
jgi:hypothetical protein